MTKKSNHDTLTNPTSIRPSSQFDPANDGIDHINILFRKSQPLGHSLSHFTRMTFTHPYLGVFTSMEGFYYYIRSGRIADEVRYMTGYEAKKKGRTYKPMWTDSFREDIMAANYQKIIQNEELYKMFVASELPFTNYYMDGGEDKKFVKVSCRDEEWICQGFEEIRKALKESRVPECWINAEKRYVAEHESKKTNTLADTPKATNRSRNTT